MLITKKKFAELGSLLDLQQNVEIPEFGAEFGCSSVIQWAVEWVRYLSSDGITL